MRLNAQAAVRAHLSKALPDAKVGVTVPRPRPEAFVLVRREGGARLDAHRDSAGIGVECWHSTEAEAADLASRMSDAMLALEREPGFASASEEAFYSDPDPEDASPRWYGSYTLITYQTD